MLHQVFAAAGLLLLGPPELPDLNDPADQDAPEAPAAPTEEPESGGGEEALWDEPEVPEPSPEEPGTEPSSALPEEGGAEEAEWETPATQSPAPAPAPAVVSEPTASPVEQAPPATPPPAQSPSTTTASGPAPAASPAAAKTTQPAAAKEPDILSEHKEHEAAKKEEEKGPPKLGGFRFFRLGIAPRIGYMHGTSEKNGLFDRDKSIQDSIDNMMVMTSGAGDLGQTQFGGPAWGGEVDLELFFINLTLDVHKFFRPGGTWSLLLGYDHEFGLGGRVRLDLGAHFGMMRVFLGDALADLYYDPSNPAAVNIATAGIEGRIDLDLLIRLAGPLYTGPTILGGYHYLFSANVAEVTEEKGFHYSAAWTLRMDFAFPKNKPK